MAVPSYLLPFLVIVLVCGGSFVFFAFDLTTDATTNSDNHIFEASKSNFDTTHTTQPEAVAIAPAPASKPVALSSSSNTPALSQSNPSSDYNILYVCLTSQGTFKDRALHIWRTFGHTLSDDAINARIVFASDVGDVQLADLASLAELEKQGIDPPPLG